MPETSIQSRLKHVYSSDVARNRQIIKSMADAILLCGRQWVTGMIVVMMNKAIEVPF